MSLQQTTTAGVSDTGAPRFVRRTTLAAHEYRKNFHQIDADVVAVVTSAAADRVTPLMSKIYLRLASAPAKCWERAGVLRFEAEVRAGKQVTAWACLCELLGVASATARKALAWLHEIGVIGYFAGRNGVGIRIFLNRALSSVGTRAGAGGQKILAFAHTSLGARRASADETPFRDSFAVSEIQDSDNDPRAPKGGAPESDACGSNVLHRPQPTGGRPDAGGVWAQARASSLQPCGTKPATGELLGEAVVARLARELVPQVRAAAAQEHERTREWFITHALPKAIRVSQRSAYDVLRAHGLVAAPRGRSEHTRGTEANGGGATTTAIAAPQRLSDEEVTELAHSCIALLEVQGQAIDATLAAMSVSGGGFLSPEDAAKVRARAESLLRDLSP